MRALAIRRSYGVELISPYHPRFVEALKAGIPKHYRDFDADTKTWWVYPPYEDAGLHLARQCFGAVEHLVPGPLVPSGSGHTAAECLERVRDAHRDHAALYVLPNAPEEVVKGAYRALALSRHPDKAGPGAHGEMVAINRAYERIQRGRG